MVFGFNGFEQTIVLSTAILSIIAGVLILTFPKLIRYALGVYLILVGVLQLL